MKPLLSIVILTYNRSKSLSECLESLTKQSFKNFEVIVVDGDSQDNTPQIIDKYSPLLNIKKYINKTPNIAKLRDYGWRQAKGEYVSWIDDDVVVSKNWAKEVIKTFENNPDVCGVSGPTLINQNIIKNRDVFTFHKNKGLIAKFWNNFILEGKSKEPGLILKNGWWTPGANFKSSSKLTESKTVDYLEACNMSYRRSVIKKVNGLDHSFYKEWSEVDLAFRVRQTGCRLIFNPKVIVHHNISQAGAYSGRTAAKERMIDFYRYYFRHVYQPKYIFRFLIIVLLQNLYYTYKTISDKNLSWLGSWLGSIIGLKYIK